MFEEAREEGATNAQIRMAHRYVDAMMGTIGESTNARVSAVLGIGKRQGEIINPRWRQFTSIMITIQNLAVLSLATITSLVDPVGILVRSQDLDATMEALRAGGREISIAIKNLVGNNKDAQKSELRGLAEALGTIEDHLTNEALEWEYGSNYLTPKLKAANEWFFKAIGLSQWTRMTRIMGLAGGKAFIKRHVVRPNKNSERFLRQLDLTAADVKFDEDGDLRILTRLEREDPTIAPEELARDDKVRNALNRFVDESILRPNAAQRPIWSSDPNYALIFHLKSFMFSFHDRILRRVASEAQLGNITPLILLAVFIPGMMMADALKDMIRYGLGDNPRKARWGIADHMWNATQRSGLTGLGQLLMDARNAQQVGETGLFELAGPTAEMISDVPDLFLGNDEQQWRQTTRNIPFQNVWRHWLENASE